MSHPIENHCHKCGAEPGQPCFGKRGPRVAMLMQGAQILVGFDLIRSAIAVTGITGPEKAVLMVLAAMANSQAQAWPPMTGETGLVAKCCLGERTVQRAIQALVVAKHIARDEKMGKGVVYTIHPRHSGTPATETPRQTVTPATQAATPATAAPKQPRTTIPKKDKPSLVKRATRIPPDFAPVMSGKTASVVAGWPPGRIEDELEHFVDHHTAKGTTSYDWQASWRTWVKNSKRWEPGNGRSNQPLGRHQPSDGLSATRRAAIRVFGPPTAGDRGSVP